ncbi:TetR/AcrR family transcriptional regulator [Vibrio sp. SCSIO 43137]|uniref:TetR/AcrR family transcriptional regulator n=1 Tax=Vibrio sp. SCSIO 43137 TaxID=3021011 RepID=UPI0023077269|nr:TetR/AcrR family transcriptional regulator [Vibrio sp. SCSIO 43137]WCE32342.1 TetR/AcrR family transcriptional regulator [Vibrio sp. SCSIO 43137]
MNQKNRTGTKHKSGVERREQILSSAMNCFIEKGYSKTTMNELVAYTGLSQGAIYHYFSGKDAIVTAILDQFSQHITKQIELLNTEGHYLDNLKNYIAESLEYYRLTYAFSTIVHEIRDNDELLKQFNYCDELITDSVRNSIEKNAHTCAQISVETLSFSITAMLEGLFSLCIQDDLETLEKRFQDVWQVIEHLLTQGSHSTPVKPAQLTF